MKTFPDPPLIPIYARRPNSEQRVRETYGNPLLEAFAKIAGALPTLARPSVHQPFRQSRLRRIRDEYIHRARELVYRSLEAADHAEVRRAALIT